LTLFECVPNISEGRDLAVIDACVSAVESCGVRVLHRTSDPIHNRSVLTMAGGYDRLREAALALTAVTVERIDLRSHAGVHPRIGALDVLPFIPLQGAHMRDAVQLAREVAASVWERLHVPCFLYAEAAATPLRRNLANVREGQFEGLDARFELPDWRPDYGDVAKHASAGALAVGARPILIAFNIELQTGDLGVARRIAARLRERDGGLRTLKALGLRLGPDLVQVSLNVTDYRATPLYRIVEVTRVLAGQAGVAVRRCELIGCLPFEAVRACALYYLGVSQPDQPQHPSEIP
jgi:glutamate formiminotransferase